MKKRIQIYLLLFLALSLLFTGVGVYIFLVTEIPSVKALKDLTNKPVSTIYGINDQVVYVVVPDLKVQPTVHFRSPRLADPSRAGRFELEMIEENPGTGDAPEPPPRELPSPKFPNP